MKSAKKIKSFPFSIIIGVFKIEGQLTLILAEECSQVVRINKQMIYRIEKVQLIPVDPKEKPKPQAKLIGFLTSGLYFSTSHNITLNQQR